jgi:hypothetical protein
MTAETEERLIEGLATINEQLKHFATKEELQELRMEMHKELQDLRIEMHKELRDQLKWIILLNVPTWLGIVGLLLKH